MKFGNRHFLILGLFWGFAGLNLSPEVSVDSGIEEERGHSISEWPMVEGLRRRKGADRPKQCHQTQGLLRGRLLCGKTQGMLQMGPKPDPPDPPDPPDQMCLHTKCFFLISLGINGQCKCMRTQGTHSV